MKFLLTSGMMLLLSLNLNAQEFILNKSVKINNPSEISLDSRGKIYLATFDGDIIRYNDTFDDREIFSPPNPNTTQILDAWQGLRIFTFHRERQQYRLINRNLSLHEDYDFPNDLIGFAEWATPSYDNNIWVVDQSDFSVKKLNIHSNRLESRTPLNLLLNPDNYEILHCQEYQNRLFVSSKNIGILIFDNFGSYIKIYNYPGIDHFAFSKDNLYFLMDNQLVVINLYNDEAETLSLPVGENYDFVLKVNDLTYLFSKNTVGLYKQKNPE